MTTDEADRFRDRYQDGRWARYYTLLQKCTLLGRGSSRTAWLLPGDRTVLKLPLYETSTDNVREYNCYRARIIPVAACRLMPDGALFMRMLDRYSGEDPEWSHPLRDVFQGGRTKLTKKLAVYDAGYESYHDGILRCVNAPESGTVFRFGPTAYWTLAPDLVVAHHARRSDYRLPDAPDGFAIPCYQPA